MRAYPGGWLGRTYRGVSQVLNDDEMPEEDENDDEMLEKKHDNVEGWVDETEDMSNEEKNELMSCSTVVFLMVFHQGFCTDFVCEQAHM